MILLGAGCSFTEGIGIKPEDNDYQKTHSWVRYLADLLKINYVNLGKGGASNCYIVRNILKYLIENPNNNYFVVIATTNVGRFDMVINNNLHSFNFTFPSNITKNFSMNTYNNNLCHYKEELEYQMLISYMHINNIKYFIYNAISDFNGNPKKSTGIKIKNVYYDNLSIDFINYSISHNFQKTACGHFYEDAHIAWANYLYNHLIDK